MKSHCALGNSSGILRELGMYFAGLNMFSYPLNTILPPETICPIYSPKKTTSISHKIAIQTSPSLGKFHVDSVLDSLWRVKGDFIPCINRLSIYPMNTKRHKKGKQTQNAITFPLSTQISPQFLTCE
jgi:hypothetical protein